MKKGLFLFAVGILVFLSISFVSAEKTWNFNNYSLANRDEVLK